MWVLLLIIIFIVPEDTLEYILGAILGGGYGILMVIAFFAILYLISVVSLFDYGSMCAVETGW